MATTAQITKASDIYSGFSGINKTMTLTQAGTLTDIEETTGFSRRKLTAASAVDLIVMADLQVETDDSKAAKIFIKNIGSALIGYKRYKEYEWRETFFASIYELDKVKRHDMGHIGFDWRWLAQTLRQNVTIVKKTSSPANFTPKFISPSIGFICVKSD